MQNRTTQESNSRFITPTGGVIALLCFFMPWFKACGMITLSGLELANTGDKGALIFVVLIAAVATIGISVYMLNQQTPWKSKLPVFISSGSGIGICCLLVVDSLEHEFLTPQFGLFGTIIGFIISLIGVWTTSKPDDSSGPPGESQYGSTPKAESRLSETEQTAEAVRQTAASAPQPAPFGCLLEGQDSTGLPFALTIPASALGDRAGVTLGRNPANAEFIIDHQEVSREHVRFTYADGALYAEDLDALNGTKVNGRLLNPRDQVLLQNNDQLEIGPVVFTVRLVQV